MTLTKGGKTATIIDSKAGWKLRDPNRHPMPCGHFGAVVQCTCRLRDWQCQTCRRVFLKAQGDVYEVVDPHPRSAPTGGEG